MNYQLLKTYLEEKVVITITIKDGKAKETHQVQNLNQHFLTEHNLTKGSELKEVLTRFYDSVKATINEDDQYYQLPAYEQLVANYFTTTTNKPSLGIKSQDEIETAIADEHYQLLDTIVEEFQTSLAPDQSDNDSEYADPTDTPLAVTQLQNQAEALGNQLAELIKAKTMTEPDPNLMAEIIRVFSAEMRSDTEPDFLAVLATKKVSDCQPLLQILLTYPESKELVTDIKQWLVDYSKLSPAEKDLLKNEYQGLSKINQLIVSCQAKKDATEAETTAKPAKEPIKNKEELLYLGGFIVILAVVAMLFKK